MIRDYDGLKMFALVAVLIVVIIGLGFALDDGKEHCYQHGTAYGANGVTWIQLEIPCPDAGAAP